MARMDRLCRTLGCEWGELDSERWCDMYGSMDLCRYSTIQRDSRIQSTCCGNSTTGKVMRQVVA
jgi:hypothetical protein